MTDQQKRDFLARVHADAQRARFEPSPTAARIDPQLTLSWSGRGNEVDDMVKKIEERP